jgi:Domain of unknown function (DUF4265)
LVDRPNAKVALHGPDGEVETLWAFDLGGGQYRLDNLPWYAYRVSLGDVIEAAADDAGQLQMVRVVRKSGNRTLRLFFQGADLHATWPEEIQGIMDWLVEHGCSYEGANRRYQAVNVPPGADLASIATFLTEADARWEYADPTYEEVHADGRTREDRPADA